MRNRQPAILILSLTVGWARVCAQLNGPRLTDVTNVSPLAGLPSCKLGNFIENRVNCYLKKKDAGAGEVSIRVVACTDKLVEVKPGMKNR